MRVTKAARLETTSNDNDKGGTSEQHSSNNKALEHHNAMQDYLHEMESLKSICAVIGARANFFNPGHLQRLLASWPKDEDSTVYKTVAEAINVFSVPLEQYWNNSQYDSNDRNGDSSDEYDNDGQYTHNDYRKKNEQGSKNATAITSTSSATLQNVAQKSHLDALQEWSKEQQQQQQEQEYQKQEKRHKSALHKDPNEIQTINYDKSLLHKKLHYRIPHARFLSETFYPSRVDAMLSRGYRAYNFSTHIDNTNSNCPHNNINSYSEGSGRKKNKQGTDLIIAIDRKFGNGGKLFNIFTRSSALDQHKTNNFQEELKQIENEGLLQNNITDKQQECITSHDVSKEICWTNSIAKFIDTIPNAYNRNLYVVIDENAPIDPFFDIDCHLPLNAANQSSSSSLTADESLVALFCREVMSEWFEVNLNNDDDDDVNDDNDKDIFVNGNETIEDINNITNQKITDLDGSEDNDAKREDYSDNASYATRLMYKVEELLLVILRYLRNVFEKSLNVKLEQSLVLTSSVAVCKRNTNTTTRSNENNNERDTPVNDNEQSMNDSELIDMKISFHVHFRLANNWVFTNIEELHRFMMKVRAQLDESILLYCHKLESANVDETDNVLDDQMQRRAEIAALVRTCVDFGVYTRWRAFRLPYNVKCPLQTCNAFTAPFSPYLPSASNASFANRNAQTLNLLTVELAEQELEHCTGLTPPLHNIGATAPYCLSCVVLPTKVTVNNEEPESNCALFSCNNSTSLDEQLEILRKAMYCFRFLLPLDPFTSTFTNKKLRVFLETYAIREELYQVKENTTTCNTENNVNSNDSKSNLSKEQYRNVEAFVDTVFDMACIQREITNVSDGDTNNNQLRRIRVPKRLAPILESNYEMKQSTGREETQNEQLLEEQEQSEEMQQKQNNMSREEEEWEPESNGAIQKSSVGRSPFSLERPPLPHSSRVLVYDRQIRSLVAEVFMCLSPLYGYHGQYQEEMEHVIIQFNKQNNSSNNNNNKDYNANKTVIKAMHTQHNNNFNDFDSVHLESISPERLTVQYEEAIRAYYVYQKQSRYCLQLNRLHRATYGQLYLTYGSIKVRCYSNDCCARCLIVPWSDPNEKYAKSEKNVTKEDKSDVNNVHKDGTVQNDSNARHSTETNDTQVVNCQNERFNSAANGFVSPIHGYPKYDRLTAIRNALFPPLPADELLKRYGMSTLRAV